MQNVEKIGTLTPEKINRTLDRVVKHRNCTGCGACVLFSETASMIRTPRGPVPSLKGHLFSEEALSACPGVGISYPDLYTKHYGQQPESYLHGMVQSVRIGYAADEDIRRRGASGGVTTAVLLHLLETRKVDGVICVQQGIPEPRDAGVLIARSKEELIRSMQSVYIPVSVLDILKKVTPGERYAMVGLPEQTAALRKLQTMKHPGALQVEYLLGPYTGTALYPAAIDAFLRSRRVSQKDPITSLNWREGEWPGYLEIRTGSGKVLQSKKIYYNFLIPFYVTHTSLRSMDFVNEFADLAVGDAWSPKYEAEGKGFSVVVTRTAKMEQILEEMIQQGLIDADTVDKEEAISMHGHMLDFKKRGGYLRNRMRKRFGRSVPDYGYRPKKIAMSRRLTELVISGIFLAAGSGVARYLMTLIPERIIGPVFDALRLKWKSISKPTKRKGLSSYEIEITSTHV